MLCLIFVAVFSLISRIYQAKGMEVFFYFAYGSNLLSNRIHIKNPSAVFYSPAKLSVSENIDYTSSVDKRFIGLQDYRLDFNMQVPMWNGAVATIVPDTNCTVWGNLWLIDSNKMNYLDKQEGVDRAWYYAKNVTVTRKDGYKIVARTYIETSDPPMLRSGEVLSDDRRPSDTYMKVIILGAVKSGLPSCYIKHLRTFPTNKKKAPQRTLESLGTLTLGNKVYKFD